MSPDDAARQREDDFLALLRQGGAVSSGGLFDASEPGLRCLLPDCPDPAHALSVPLPAVVAAPLLPQAEVHPGWRLPNLAWRWLWLGWAFLRQVSGDDAYERYLAHMAHVHPGRQPMTRAEHFAWRQEQKWNRLSRCC